MAQSAQMHVESTDNAQHVRLHGRLDSAGVEELELKFFAATAAARKHAVVDLSEVTFLASMAIRMLVMAAKRVVRGGHQLVLLNPTGLVDETLETADLYSLIPVARSEEEANALIEG